MNDMVRITRNLQNSQRTKLKSLSSEELDNFVLEMIRRREKLSGLPREACEDLIRMAAEVREGVGR